MRQSSEPSVEEILESIKKVIARDNRVSADDGRRQRETHGIPIHVVRQRDEADAIPEADEVLDLADSAEFLDEPQDELPADSPLIGENARTSMRDSLAALAMLAEPGAAPQIVRSGETSLETMARDLLRPALAEWLDRNLPPLVERMVAAEISRIVGKKG